MAVFVCGLLFYANALAFNLISAPIFISDIITYAALTVAVTLTVITLTIVIRDKRRSLFAKTQKSIVTNSDKESIELPSTILFPVDSQENADKVESIPAVAQIADESDKAPVTSLPKSSRKKNLIAILIAIIAGLLLYVNVVSFRLVALPEYTIYFALAGVVALIITIIATALVDKRKDALTKAPIVEVVGAINKSDSASETPNLISSPTIAQTRADKVESNIATIDTTKVPDETPAPIAPQSKVFSKRNLFAIIFAFTVGLLLIANAGAFDLINLPENATYAFISGATVLTIVTIAIASIDKRKSETPKVPDEKLTPITRLARVFEKRNLFAIIFAFTVGLLLIANAGAFDLINLPENAIYSTVAGAVALEAITLTIILGEKIKVLGHRIKSFLTEPKIQEVIKENKEPGQAPAIAPVSVIAQTSTKKVDPYAEMLRQLGVQKTARKLEADNAEQQKKLPKKPVIPPTKVICPACRKEFNLAIYERDYIVDFGPTKKTNLIKICPNCQASILLKRRGILREEDIWKE